MIVLLCCVLSVACDVILCVVLYYILSHPIIWCCIVMSHFVLFILFDIFLFQSSCGAALGTMRAVVCSFVLSYVTLCNVM